MPNHEKLVFSPDITMPSITPSLHPPHARLYTSDFLKSKPGVNYFKILFEAENNCLKKTVSGFMYSGKTELEKADTFTAPHPHVVLTT